MKAVYLVLVIIIGILFYFFYAFINTNVINPISASGTSLLSDINENQEEINIGKLNEITANFEKKTTHREKFIKNIFK